MRLTVRNFDGSWFVLPPHFKQPAPYELPDGTLIHATIYHTRAAARRERAKRLMRIARAEMIILRDCMRRDD